MLVDFLELPANSWLAKERRVKLEQVLGRQLVFRLMEATFDKMERMLLEKRLARLGMCKGIPRISCVECRGALATAYCKQCQDYFCSNCSDSIHENEIYKKHDKIAI